MIRRLKPFQRQYAEHALALTKVIRDHHQALHDAETAGDREAALAAHGAMSDAFRMLGQLDPAVRHGEQAVELARALDRKKSLVANLIRLATALQYRNEHDAAEPLFAEGRALAVACFERALALREAKGEHALIDSTREALDEARARLG